MSSLPQAGHRSGRSVLAGSVIAVPRSLKSRLQLAADSASQTLGIVQSPRLPLTPPVAHGSHVIEVDASDLEADDDYHITHWMPLPKPPAAILKRKEGDGHEV